MGGLDASREKPDIHFKPLPPARRHLDPAPFRPAHRRGVIAGLALSRVVPRSSSMKNVCAGLQDDVHLPHSLIYIGRDDWTLAE